MNTLRRFILAGLVLAAAPAVHAGPPFPEFVDPNPNSGNQFGAHVVPLSTGNVVITAPKDDAGGTDAGAVYLFNGATGALISTLRGSSANDRVGISGVTALSNGNYVVRSPQWSNGGAASAGAVTWGSGTSGISGVVSASNSLVGSTAFDSVGSEGVTALSNGNYVVRSQSWTNGAGAVTWGSGNSGISGVVSASNSLVGSTTGDSVGSAGVTALSNGNYVVSSQFWWNGAAFDAGAVTWGNGNSGISGVVSSSNSLVGSTTGDSVGSAGVTALSNGNYVVSSQFWDNGAGAVTWGSGTSGISGVVSSANSLVGSTTHDNVGNDGVTALSNGNYVVSSSSWWNGAASGAGAVTWGNGTSGISGAVSSANSLVGSTAGDAVGSNGVTALSNGNYVVSSQFWDNGAVANVGAVTWCNGTTGITGTVSGANSLVGSTTDDNVGNAGVTALSNGNYVVRSQYWSNGAVAFAGAVTWGSGTTGITGTVSSANSLVGSTAADQVGSTGVTALSNGNYLVVSTSWSNSNGAVTWGSGTAGVSGAVSSVNSLVGSTANDQVGGTGVTALSNGNYVVSSQNWDNGAATNAGAVTWGSSTSGISGAVSSSNSLVGSTAGDQVGSNGVTALSNGNYVVKSILWSNGAATNAGAVTWGSGTAGVSGTVSSSNSLVGSATNEFVGSVTPLSNGNYLVVSTSWSNSKGAVTWGSGTAGVSGVVSSTNSLVGSTSNDNVGNDGVTALSNGNYVVNSPNWDNGAATDAGAVTWGSGTTGISGAVSPSNSLVGLTSNASLMDVSVDNTNSTYMARFRNEANGKVRLGSQVDGLAVSPPTVTSVSPAVASIGSSVTIMGTGFTGATSVTIGGVAVLFTVVDDTHITTTVPAGVNGLLNVVVTNAGGPGTGTGVLSVVDYVITTTGNAIVITDVSGKDDFLHVTSGSAGATLMFAATGRTFSVNGAPSIPDNSGLISRAGATSITINAGAGNDQIEIGDPDFGLGTFALPMPSLTVNAGSGNDTANFSGDVTFGNNTSLDMDLQNDDADPGQDHIMFVNAFVTHTNASFAITLRASVHIIFLSSSIDAGAGGLTAEANGGLPSNLGIYATGSTLNSSGSIFMKGTSPLASGILLEDSEVTPRSDLTLIGHGNYDSDSSGVRIAGTMIDARGNISITGQLDVQAGESSSGVGIVNGSNVRSDRNIDITGTGAPAGDYGNVGVWLADGIVEASGSLTVNGTGGQGSSSGDSWHGIFIQIGHMAGSSVTMTGIAGTGNLVDSHGIYVDNGWGESIYSDGDISLNGSSTNAGSYGVVIDAQGGGAVYGVNLVRVEADTANFIDSSGGGHALYSDSDVIVGPSSMGRKILVGEMDSLAAHLGLEQSELGLIYASSSLLIGSASTGIIEQTADTQFLGGIPDVTYRSGNEIRFTNSSLTTDGGNFLARPGPGHSFYNTGTGTDLDLSGGTAGFSSGAKLGFRVTSGTVYDTLKVNGAVSLSDVVLNLEDASAGAYTPSAAQSFTLIDNDGSDPVTGNFTGLVEGATVSVNGVNKVISYVGGDGNDVVLNTAVILPTVTAVAPNSGTTAGNTAVTITGTGFTGATGVTFGGNAAAPFTLVNDTTITTTTPIHAAGAVSVEVTTPGGTNMPNTLYTYVLPAGTPDPAFGTGGVTVTPISPTAEEWFAVDLQADGKIVTAGRRSGPDRFAVGRYTSSGVLDSTFGSGGLVYTTVGNPGAGGDLGKAVKVLPDGKILVGGYASTSTAYDFALARYTSAGVLDTTFGTGGTVRTDIAPGSYDQVFGMAVGSDGKIVLVGASIISGNFDTSVARYLSNGSLDTSFGTGGKVVIPTGLVTSHDFGRAAAILPDGKVLVAGYAEFTGNGDDFVLMRLTSTGQLDSTFGTAGVTNVHFGTGHDRAEDMVVQPDGRIILSGLTATANWNHGLARFLPNGTVDASFGTNGRVSTDFASNHDYGHGLALQPDGKIVMVGGATLGSAYDQAVSRYLSNGTLDTSFGTGGKKTNATGAGNDEGVRVVVTADGGIVVAGLANNVTNTNAEFSLARYIGTPAATPADIALEQPAGTSVADGATVSFGNVVIESSSAPRTFTITNPGTVDLNSLALMKDGANAAEFTVSSLSATTLSTGSGTLTFTVTFSPTSAGAKTAAIRLFSNVIGAESPYDITLTGTALPPPPTVTAIFPTSGGTAGGTSVTLTGTNFITGATVTIGGADATSISVVNPTTITAFTPLGNEGAASVIVTTSGGTNAANALFTYVNTPPTITSNGGEATGTQSVAENTTAVTTVTANDTDLPAQTLSYSLSGGADQAKFSIVPATGVLSFLTAPNFEDPTDTGTNNVYEVIVKATDDGTGGLFDTQALSITVTDVNDAPTLARTDATVTVNEGSLAANTGTFGDDDGKATVTLTASVGTVTPNNMNGTWSWAYTPPDGPSGPTTVTITATDNGITPLIATTTFSLTVDNVAPVYDLGAPVFRTAAGYGATVPFVDPGADTWTGTVDYGDGTGSGALSIVPASKTFGLSHSYSLGGVYTVSTTLTDDDGGTLSDSVVVDVILKPILTTGSASAVTAYTATVSGNINPNHGESTVWFEYSTDATLATGVLSSAAQTIPAGTSAVPVAHALAALFADSDYYFRIVANNAAGTSQGSIQTFRTPYAMNSGATIPDLSNGGGSLYRPYPGVINNAGRIAFIASGSVGSGGITAGNDSLLMTDASGSMKSVGRETDVVSGGGTLTGGFNDFLLSEGGILAARDTLAGATLATDATYLSSTDGISLGVLSREGDAAPGVSGGTFINHTNKAAMDSNGLVYFSGTLSGVVAAKNGGIWYDNGTTLNSLVLKGAAAPTGTSVALRSWFGPIAAAIAAGGDGCAFIATLQNNPDNATQTTAATLNQAVFSASPTGGASLVARRGDTVPDTGGALINSFSSLSRSGNGSHHAMVGLLKTSTSVNTTNDQVLYAVIGSTPQLIAREGTTLIGSTGLTPSLFGTFYVTNSGDLIFKLTLKAALTTNDGILCRWTAAGGISVIAREGDTAPGTGGATYGTFQNFCASENGNVVVQTVLSDSNLCLHRDKGAGAGMELVVKNGDTITLNGTVRSILGVSTYTDGVALAGVVGGTGGMGSAINNSGAIFTVLSLGNSEYIARIYR